MRRERDPRTGPFDRAIRESEFTYASSLLGNRHRYWLASILEAGEAKDDDQEVESDHWVSAILLDKSPLYPFVFVAFMGLAGAYVAGHTAGFLFVVPVAIIYGIARVIKHAKSDRMKARSAGSISNYERLTTRHCPSCQYDLSRCRDEFPVEEEGSLGPLRCPECGTFWPLVPEPTPDELSRWHQAWFRPRV